MKKISKIFIIILMSMFICNESQSQKLNDEFVLNGNLEGIENAQWVYLILDGKIIDSTQVQRNSFSFSGKLDHPKQFNLFIKNTQNYTSIWIEPGELEFEAKNGAFKEAQITGSKTQKEDELLMSLVSGYRSRRDSLTKITIDPNSSTSLKESAREEIEIMMRDHLKIEVNYIKNNSKSYYSIHLLDYYSKYFSNKKVEELYNGLDESLKSSTFAENIKSYLALSKGVKVGDRFTDFSMKDEKGQFIKLSDFEGKLVLVDFWASWCGPCIEEYPSLKKAYSKFKNQGFEIIGVSGDQTEDAWLRAIEKHHLEWINLWDDKGMKADPFVIYKVVGLPDNLLINDKGIIIARNLRGEKLIEAVELNIKKSENKGND